MRHTIATTLALILAMCGITTAHADGPNVIASLPTQSITGQCPAGVPITFYAKCERRTDTGARRGIWGGFNKTTSNYPVKKLNVYSYTDTTVDSNTVNYSTYATNGSAYATGDWDTRSNVSVYVEVILTNGGICGYHFGSP